MRLSHDPLCRLSRLVFCVTMALVWANAPLRWSRAADPPQLPAAQRLVQARNSLRALDDARRQLPRDSFDPQAVLQQIGKEPTALFAWVRDQTCWVPYHGLLREDVGVLMDRMGNSLDRAYLLASLLKIAGHPVRLAHAPLDAKTAESLLAKVRLQPLPRVSKSKNAAMNAQVLATARSHQIDQAMMSRTLSNYVVQTSQMQRKVVQRDIEQAPFVRSMIAAPNAGGAAADHAAAISALQDHWWVQWNDGSAWRDMDPIVADGAAGSAVANAQQTIDFASVPDELRQQVSVRVVIERWKDAKPEESVVLEHAFCPGSVIGNEIHFGHVAMDWPGDFNIADTANLQPRLKAAVLAQHEWAPVLMVGSDVFMKSSFTDSGEVKANPHLSSEGREGRSVVGSGQGVLGAFGGGDAAAAAPTGVLTAEWIEYEIRIPGQAPQRIRRQIMDLVGPAARASGHLAQPALDETQRLRRGLALYGQTDILVCGCRLSGAYMAGKTIDALLANQKMILAAAGDDAALNNPASARTLVEGIRAMPGDLEELASVRFGIGHYRNRVFLASPNILSRHLRLNLENNGQIMGCRALDIVANEVGVTSAADVNPFNVRLEQGVIDTNLESALLSGCGVLHSAAESFAATAADPKQWMVLKNANDPALAQLNLPADAKARISADLASGDSVVVPRLGSSSMIAWWRINPLTGSALGIGENGWGPSLVEYAETALISFMISLATCELGMSLLRPNDKSGDTLKFCLAVAIMVALLAVLAMFLLEGLEAGGAGGGAGGTGGGGGGPVDPYGPTAPAPGGGGPPPGGGGGGPLPGGGGGGPPLPSGGGGPPLGGGGGGGSGGASGGGNFPGGIDPLGRTGWDVANGTLSNSGAMGDATLNEGAVNTLAGLGGTGGTLPP